ncbi:MAG: BrnT family toxin [Anaerolineaceae bacterium]|nr:BrnT family toxin [Anaerolineaceae bacterium]
MKKFSWNEEKDRQLQAERNISFAEAAEAIAQGRVLDLIEHPNQEKYPGQRMFILEINEYAWLVPFVEDEMELFFKTVIPSRKATRKYLRKGDRS